MAFGLARSAGSQVPVGAEFRVDVGGNPLPGGYPFVPPKAVTMTPGGGFVVAWTTPGLDVMARRFGPAGVPLGASFLVNSYTTSAQYAEQVAADDAGNFVVVWVSRNQQGNYSRGLFAQRFAASGTRLGDEFQVNVVATGRPFLPAVAMAPAGDFVVVWSGGVGPPSYQGVLGRRFLASGIPVGGEFRVDTSPFIAGDADVDMDGSGNFVVVWGDTSNADVLGQRFDASGAREGAEFFVSSPSRMAFAPKVSRRRNGSFVVGWRGDDASDDRAAMARRFDSAGQALGAEFRVSVYTTGTQFSPSLAVEDDGGFLAVWTSEGQDGDNYGVFGRAFDESASGGPEFRVNTETSGWQGLPDVSSDSSGNLIVAWQSNGEMRAQRYGRTLVPAALVVDATVSPSANGNGVFEAGEVVAVAPSWSNVNLAPQAFGGSATAFTGPGTSGDPTYTIADGAADYGSADSGATASCTSTGDCYALGISLPTTRPAVHWDAAFREEIVPASLGAAKDWSLHVGDSFSDVPRSNPFYRFVETLLHHGVTGGCTTTTYCPGASTTRDAMAVFVLVSKGPAGFVPPPCGATPMFADVPVTSGFCRWVEELARRGVVSGCAPNLYCPSAHVTREQMGVFVLRTLDPTLSPPPCVAGSEVFADVPASNGFCRWIEELFRRGVVTGCGGALYCPLDPVTREQMGVFIGVTFGLTLYGP